MGSNNNKTISVSLFLILFVLYPIATLPYLIKGMIQNKRWAFIFFAIFMGLIGFLWPPYGDMYRYALDLYNMRGMDWEVFQLFMLIRFDIFLPYLSYLMANIGGSFDIIKFLFNFLGYIFVADVLRMVIRYNKIYIQKRYYVCALILIIPFSLNGYLFRSGLGAIILLNACIRWFYLRKKSGLILCLLSALVHVSNIPFIFLFIVSSKEIFTFRYRIVVFLFAASFLVSFGGLAEYILKLLPLPDNMVGHIYQYIDGSQAHEITRGFSIKQFILYIFNNILNYIWILIYFLLYKKNSGKFPMAGVINIMFVFLLLISSFPFMYGRYFGLTVMMIKAVVLLNLSSSLLSYVNFKRICYLTLFFICVSFYENRFCLTIGNVPHLLTSSLSGILQTEYTEDWIIDNLNSKGDFYKRIQMYGEPE